MKTMVLSEIRVGYEGTDGKYLLFLGEVLLSHDY
jgi:hypothetical protein